MIVFVDGFDVACSGPALCIFSAYDHIHHALAASDRLIFSTESNCYPRHLCSGYARNTTRFLNTGCWMGTVRAVRRFLQWMPQDQLIELCRSHAAGDQVYGHAAFQAHPEWFALDEQSRLCQSMFNVDRSSLQMRNNSIVNIHTGIAPCFLHFNGGGHQKDGLRNVTMAIMAGGGNGPVG